MYNFLMHTDERIERKYWKVLKNDSVKFRVHAAMSNRNSDFKIKISEKLKVCE